MCVYLLACACVCKCVSIHTCVYMHTCALDVGICAIYMHVCVHVPAHICACICWRPPTFFSNLLSLIITLVSLGPVSYPSLESFQLQRQRSMFESILILLAWLSCPGILLLFFPGVLNQGILKFNDELQTLTLTNATQCVDLLNGFKPHNFMR